MQPFDEQLKRVNEKLGLLIRQFQVLQKENEKLRQEVQEVGKRRESIAREKEKLEQQVAVLKLSRSDMSETDKKALEKRLTDYVKEIDRCIAMLSE